MSGQWGFCSGSGHADLFVNGAFIMDGDAPHMIPGRGPGLALRRPARARADGPRQLGRRRVARHREPRRRRLGRRRARRTRHVAAVRAGPPRRPPVALPLLHTRRNHARRVPARRRPPGTRRARAVRSTRIRPSSPTAIAHDGDLQVALARSEGGLQSARSFVIDTLGALWDTARAGDVPGDAQRVRFLLATQQAMPAAIEAVDTAYGFGGAAALHADHPLQRCFRDIHAAAQHIYFSPASAKRYAMSRLRIDQPGHWF
ncbi:hypothetical protein [Pseudonocardia sp. GCM10023141]|uniref:hypothetical protein n=1 Tax=Pseudonocardia sp. GCM10023141 TaxID=3252653 RepID=UPI0036201D9C